MDALKSFFKGSSEDTPTISGLPCPKEPSPGFGIAMTGGASIDLGVFAPIVSGTASASRGIYIPGEKGRGMEEFTSTTTGGTSIFNTKLDGSETVLGASAGIGAGYTIFRAKNLTDLDGTSVSNTTVTFGIYQFVITNGANGARAFTITVGKGLLASVNHYNTDTIITPR